jgi:hypothetical protein
MREVFIGSQAVRSGELTDYQLRRDFRSIHQDVYVPKSRQVSLRDRTVGAWLWSKQRATIAGRSAAALHGAQWIDDDIPVELIWRNTHPPNGVFVRNERLHGDETKFVARLPVTTPARTAFDLGRHLPRGQALERLDALMRATPFATSDVQLIAKCHEGARGVRQLRELLPLVDGGAASPKETWLRLLLIDAGFPKPTTQILAADGRKLLAMLDMGWEQFKVAAEYDGDQHRTDRRQYVRDIRRIQTLQSNGWIVIRVIAEDRPDDVIARVRKALASRGLRQP